MSNSHKGSRLLVKDAVYAVPFESVHFDFNQDTTGMTYGDVIQPISGNYAIKSGKFGNSIFLEEATTNLLNNVDFSNYAGYTNFTTTVIDDISSLTGKSLIFQANASGSINSSARIGIYTSAVSGNYTVSVYAKGVGTTIGKKLRMYAGTWIEPENTVLTADYQRFVFPSALINSTQVAFSVRANSWVNGEQIILHSPQMEAKTYETSFVNGSRVKGGIEYSNPTEGLSDFTISFWINKLNYAGGNEPFVNISPDTNVNGAYFDGSSSSLRYFVYDSSGTSTVLSTSGLPINTWSHVAGVKSGSTISLYVNGVLKASGTASGTVALTGLLQMGKRRSVSSQVSNIILDEVRIDRYAATAEEINSWFIANTPFYNPYDYRGYAY